MGVYYSAAPNRRFCPIFQGFAGDPGGAPRGAKRCERRSVVAGLGSREVATASSQRHGLTAMHPQPSDDADPDVDPDVNPGVDPDDASKRAADTSDRTSRLRQEYLPQGGPKPMALAGAGLELCGAVLVLTLGGWWLDSKVGSSPWLMIGGLAVGTIGGIYNLWKRGSRFFSS